MNLTNKTFLRAIFGSDWGNAHVAGFMDSPDKVMSYKWSGDKLKRRGKDFISSPGRKNTFYCISTFEDVDGKAYRRHALHESTYAIMLDDVACGQAHGITGAKISAELLRSVYSLEPTCVIETSPGNAQWVFAVEPEPDGEKVKRFQSALVDSKLTKDGVDPGLRDTTRYARLPCGQNNKSKYGRPWTHKVHEWHSERRTTLDGLARTLGIDLELANSESFVPVLPPSDANNDPVLGSLYRLDMVFTKQNQKKGTYNISCPWRSNHTIDDNTGTAYIEPGFVDSAGNVYHKGGFHCCHSGCSKRTIGDLISWLIEAGEDVSVAYDASMFDNVDSVDSGGSVAESEIVPVFYVSDASLNGYATDIPPQRDWLVDNIIPSGKVGVIVAPGGVGKSLISMQLGIDGAINDNFLGSFKINRFFKSLMLFCEDDATEIHRRVYGICRNMVARNVVGEDFRWSKLYENCWAVSLIDVSLKLTQYVNRQLYISAMFSRLVETINNFDDLDLVVFDPAIDFNGGDENSAVDSEKFVKILRRIVAETGVTLIVIHHANKNSMRTSDQTQSASRGSSALTDGVRFQLQLSRATLLDVKKYSLSKEDQYTHIKFYGVKNNYGKLVEPIWLRYHNGAYVKTELFE